MARSKCLDNLRRKRKLNMLDNRRYRQGVKNGTILLKGGITEIKLGSSRVQIGSRTQTTFSDLKPNRPSSLTKNRKEVYDVPKRKERIPLSDLFKSGAERTRLPRKLKKALRVARLTLFNSYSWWYFSPFKIV